MTKHELLQRVMAVPGVANATRAEHVVTAVFQALRHRLTPEEADDVWAQLPSSWKALWEDSAWWDRMAQRLKGFDKPDYDAFLARVHLHINHRIPVEQAVRVVFHALKEQISHGEAEDIAAQLPQGLKQTWLAA